MWDFQKPKKLPNFTKSLIMLHKLNSCLQQKVNLKHKWLSMIFIATFFNPNKKIIICLFPSFNNKQVLLKSFLVLFFLVPAIKSYTQDTLQKPKIGLVLSGGGAKGLAHIGALKVIDSLNIKVDYIAGTSMGAIIGGLYASGYSGKELEYAFSQLDIEKLVQDLVPRNVKTFHQKRNDELYFLTLPFKKFKISSPKGFSKGMYNFNNLSRLTYHVREISDFSKLPIPFFCIATDIETGKQVLLNKGNLAQAMIASGALPTLYNPVEIDGNVLVDGGVVNNYPIDEIKKMGVQYIIGVDVQDGLKKRSQLESLTKVLMQISSFSSYNKMEEKIKQTNVYIKPNVDGYNILSFEKSNELIKSGTLATIEVLEKLVALKNNYSTQKTPIQLTDSLFIKSIETNVLKNYTRAYILGKLHLKENKKISFDTFEKGINTLNATENFSSILYHFDQENNLLLNIKENEINTLLKSGIHYDGLYKSGALINITQKKLFSKNDVAYLDVILGDHFRYNFNYYIDNGFYWSFGINSRLNTFNKNIQANYNNANILANLNSINIDFSDFSNRVFLETTFSNLFVVGMGAEMKHLEIKSPTFQNSRPIFNNSDYFSLFGTIKFDSFDKKFFPKSGWYLNGEAKTYIHSFNSPSEFVKFSTLKGDVGIVK
ncbi:MAG TPA: patatin, partial [Flavobacterium sp.]|nr:patatin [Flavobacterium sp.]